MDEHASPIGPASSRDAVERRGDWTVEREELFAWLTATASQAASVYAGAVAILRDDQIPGRHYFIWHTIREIRSVLPRAINGGGTVRFEPAPLISALAAAWRQDELPLAELGAADASAEPDVSGELPTLTISLAVASAVVRLVNGSEAVRIRFSDANQQALAKVLGRDVPPYVAIAWSKAFADAPKYAHIPDKPHPIDETANAVEGFLAFEATLMTITRKSFENMDELDAILARANRS